MLIKTKIRGIIRSVARWKSVAEQFNTQEMLERIESMDEELVGLMAGLGAEIVLSSVRKMKS